MPISALAATLRICNLTSASIKRRRMTSRKSFRLFSLQKYSDYFASHPGAMSEPVAPERILPGKMKLPLPVPHNRQEWIDQQVMLADRLLFDKGCKLCHVMIEGNTPLPAVAKSSIPARWLLHADFNHDSHRLLTCMACHNRTPDSRDTADILLPGIASCRSCHQQQGAKHDAASGNCSECHSYHDWSREAAHQGKVFDSAVASREVAPGRPVKPHGPH